jgi:hypothetical protein
MLDRLIEYLDGLSHEELAQVSLQELALCSAWYQSRAHEKGARQEYAHVVAAVERWLTLDQDRPVASEGRRQQWLLRETMEALLTNGPNALTRDELDFLRAAYWLAKKVEPAALYSRLCATLEPHMEAIDARRRSLPVAEGLPALSGRFHVVTEGDLKRAAFREEPSFAGLELSVEGPWFECTGHLNVLGSVPDGCVVSVEGGSCYVQGFVLGHVAATRDCEILENIGGVVVSRRGDIRARNIVANARVVAKKGSVHCLAAQMPALVFAGGRIAIAEDAVMGRLIAPRIRVAGQVRGGILQVSECVEAGRFRNADTRKLALVLRRELTPRDYGEKASKKTSRLISQAKRLRRRIAEMDALAEAADREAQISGRSAFIYLCAGGQGQEALEQISVADGRVNVLSRLISVMRTFSTNVEDHALAIAGGAADEETSPRSLPGGDTDLDAFDSEQMDNDLAERLTDLLSMRERLRRRPRDAGVLARVVLELREHLKVCGEERQTLVDSIARKQRKLRHGVQGAAVALLSGVGPEDDPLNVLRRAINLARARSPQDILGKRLRDSFFRSLVRTTKSGVDRAGQCRYTGDTLLVEFLSVSKELREEHEIDIPQALPTGRAEAVGRFDDGVRLCTDFFLVDDLHSRPGSVIDVRGSGVVARTYLRAAGTIVEVD